MRRGQPHAQASRHPLYTSPKVDRLDTAKRSPSAGSGTLISHETASTSQMQCRCLGHATSPALIIRGTGSSRVRSRAPVPPATRRFAQCRSRAGFVRELARPESAVVVTSPCSIVHDGRVSITALRECHTEMVEINVTFYVIGI